MAREQSLVLVNSSFTRVIFIRQAELHKLEEIDRQLVFVAIQPEKNTSRKQTMEQENRMGVGRGDMDSPAAHNWFPKGEPRCRMVS